VVIPIDRALATVPAGAGVIEGKGGFLVIILERPFCAVFIILGVLLILMRRRLDSKVAAPEEIKGPK